ncbi:MAG: type II secretion system F family protein, partial [Planctomycetes bacterium]|nr:type II secretion system F family protein [Planctomycetota bacterium]
ALTAGEKSGDLAGALGHLADHYALRQEMKNRWVEALIYPTFLCLVGVLGLIFMGIVSHQYEEAYTALGRSLPYLTDVILRVGRQLVPIGVGLGIGFAAALFLVRALLLSAVGRMVVDRVLLTLPVIGRILQADIVARFCHTLGLLLGSAVPLPEALRVAGPALDNAVFARAVARLERHVVNGGAVGQFIEMERLFPSTVAWLIACGESRGDLPGALLDAGAFYAREARHRFSFLRDAVGPILVILAAVGVFGVFILGLFLPMIDLIRSMC